MRRRRLLQAGLALPLLRWLPAGAQSPDRNLLATERPAAPGVTQNLPLLVAPRRALVIGNSKYDFGPLKNPANDARAIGEELKRTGFDVVVGLDLPRKQMLEAILAYSASLTRDHAVGLFYFAGHGVQLAWRNYLLPTDAAISKMEDIQATCVDVNAVIEGIARAANPMNVIILDACRENPFGKEVKVEQKGLSQLDAPAGTLLAYATALREIKVPEAKIEDVFKRVRLTVRRRSSGAQIPWESTSLEEDFWFLPPKEPLRLAQEEATRLRKAQEAERLKIDKMQRETAEQQRREQEAERALKERIEKARQEELAQLRREQEAQRLLREKMEKARQAEAERLQRELEAERARLAEQEQERREKLEQEREEAIAKAYEAELAFWQKVTGTKQRAPLEGYLGRYPSGHFAELAQLELDTLLASQGEKKVEIAPQAQNPYTQGTSRADTAYKIGDRYTFVRKDPDTGEVQAQFTQLVTSITDEGVIFNNGALIFDRLGNLVKQPDGRRNTPRQDQPLEYVVGKKWTTRFSVTNNRGGVADSEFTFRITGRQKVTVPAGTFDCFVIDGDGFSYTGAGFKVQLKLKRWMAPERVRRPIISETFRKIEGRVGAPRRRNFGKKEGQVLQNERVELVEFRQG